MGSLVTGLAGALGWPWVKPNWSKDLGIVRAWCWLGASGSSAGLCWEMGVPADLPVRCMGLEGQ